MNGLELTAMLELFSRHPSLPKALWECRRPDSVIGTGIGHFPRYFLTFIGI
jgi:hypothetical protein